VIPTQKQPGCKECVAQLKMTSVKKFEIKVEGERGGQEMAVVV